MTDYGVDAHDKVANSVTNDYQGIYIDLKYEVPEDVTVCFQYEQLDREAKGTDLNEFRFAFIQRF